MLLFKDKVHENIKTQLDQNFEGELKGVRFKDIKPKNQNHFLIFLLLVPSKLEGRCNDIHFCSFKLLSLNYEETICISSMTYRQFRVVSFGYFQ